MVLGCNIGLYDDKVCLWYIIMTCYNCWSRGQEVILTSSCYFAKSYLTLYFLDAFFGLVCICNRLNPCILIYMYLLLNIVLLPFYPIFTLGCLNWVYWIMYWACWSESCNCDLFVVIILLVWQWPGFSHQVVNYIMFSYLFCSIF
jgi:hypothetical protein